MREIKKGATTAPHHENQDKDNIRCTQLQTIFQYLKDHIATASMVTRSTGIPQKCITRYKRDLEKASVLWEVAKKDCKITGCKAWYLTTDENKVRILSQVKFS